MISISGLVLVQVLFVPVAFCTVGVSAEEPHKLGVSGQYRNEEPFGTTNTSQSIRDGFDLTEAIPW